MQFVKLLTNTKTPHGNFYKGETRCVDDDVAGFLIFNGWAEKTDVHDDVADAPDDIPAVTLDVQNANLGMNSEDVSSG